MIANYMFKIAGTILAGLSNIFFLFVMPKLLGPAAYGLYVYVQNFWLQIFSFMEVNSTTYFAQQVAKSRAGQKLRNVYFSYWLVIILFCVAIAGLVPTFVTTTKSVLFLGLLAFGTFFATQQMLKLCDGAGISKVSESVRIIYRFGLITLFFTLFFRKEISLELYLQIFSFLNVIYLGALLYVFNRYMRQNKGAFDSVSFLKIIKDAYNFCAPIFVGSLLISAGLLFDFWLLKSEFGAEEVGRYSYSLMLFATVSFLSAALQPLYHRVFSIAQARHYHRLKRLYLTTSLSAVVCVALIGSVLFVLLGPLIISRGSPFAVDDMMPILLVICTYPVMQSIGQVLTAVIYAGEEVLFVRSVYSAASLLGLPISYVLIKISDLGAVGLAIKLVFIQSISLGLFLRKAATTIEFSHLLFFKFIITQTVLQLVIVQSMGLFISVDSILSAGIIICWSIVVNYLCFLSFPGLYAIDSKSGKALRSIHTRIMKLLNVRSQSKDG